MVGNVIFGLAAAGELKTMSCNAGYRISATLAVFGRVGIMTVWGIRTAALYQGNLLVTGFLASLGLVIVVLAAHHVPFVTCSGGRAISKVPAEVPAILTLLFELVSTILATYKALTTLRTLGPVHEQKKSLLYVVMQQGLLYFGLISLFGLGNVILLYIPSFRGTSLERSLSALNIPLSGLMTARYILCLREWEKERSGRFTMGQPDNNQDISTAVQWMEEVLSDPLFSSFEVDHTQQEDTPRRSNVTGSSTDEVIV